MRILRPLGLLLLLPGLLAARTFTVLVYNVENLVDVDGKAVFDDYQPERYGRPHLLTKLKNISRVVASFEGGKGPDVILFQEIEADQTPGATPPDYAAILQRYAGTNIGTMLGSGFTPEIADLPAEALLLKAFHDVGLTGYHVVAGESVTVKDSTNPLAQTCVTFTRLPVKAAASHPTLDARAILEVQVEVEGATLYLFNNHWKSGAGDPKSEPTRVANARTLRARLDAILAADPQADIVVGGDFNSQYNQKQRYAAMKVTGMNDILGSQGNELAIRGRERDLYNLWFEVPASQRGSDTYREEWGTLMQLLITRGLYDLRGVQYVDNSFGVTRLRGVNMDYLGLPYRWTFAGPAGGGFSDHFPIYAKFRVVPDNQPDRYVALQNAAQEDGAETINRVDLSKIDLSAVAIRVKDLPKDADLRDGRYTGKVLLVDGEAGAGKNLTVRVRGDLYDTWCPDPALRDRLRESYEVGKRIRFYGELGQYKGRWQFVIRDRSWILKKSKSRKNLVTTDLHRWALIPYPPGLHHSPYCSVHQCPSVVNPELVPSSPRMPALTVYTYANCDTCRRAVKWLQAAGVAFVEKPIRETPPTLAELRTMLAAHGGELRRLFNTSGRDYREQQLGEKLPGLAPEAALKLLAGNGNLVKRPFALGSGVALVGFDPAAWKAALRTP